MAGDPLEMHELKSKTNCYIEKIDFGCPPSQPSGFLRAAPADYLHVVEIVLDQKKQRRQVASHCCCKHPHSIPEPLRHFKDSRNHQLTVEEVLPLFTAALQTTLALARAGVRVGVQLANLAIASVAHALEAVGIAAAIFLTLASLWLQQTNRTWRYSGQSAAGGLM